MDYKELADRLKKKYKANETGSTFVTLCSRRDVINAATVITELLARAEKAEREVEKYKEMISRERPCGLCENQTTESSKTCLSCDRSFFKFRPYFKMKE